MESRKRRNAHGKFISAFLTEGIQNNFNCIIACLPESGIAVYNHKW